MNELKTTLDMGKETYVSLKCKQNDDRTLILTLLSNGVTWIPEVDSILELRGKRPDSTVTIQTTTGITIVNNVVTIELIKEFTRVPGTVELELNIRGIETELTTFTFRLIVIASVLYDGLDIVDMTPPSVISDFVATKGTNSIKLTWVNPPELDLVGVKIVRQTGHYPTDINDGIVVFIGVTPIYVDNDVVTGTPYFYRAFPYDAYMNYNNSTVNQQVSATLAVSVIYGVKIDTTNSNPSTAITYTDDAIGFTNASNVNSVFSYGSWKDRFPFNLIKPCRLKAGVLNYYLNQNDYTKKEDGITSSDITTVTDGDVMVEFPKMYWKIETIGTDLYVKISNIKVDNGYECLAHLRGNTEKDKCYIGAYIGAYSGGATLTSISGTSPLGNQTIGTFRDLANTKGYGYDLIAHSQLLMIQILFLIMFKNRDSQSALGRGYVDKNISKKVSGGTNRKGLFYGDSTGKVQMKFCGLEDLWGNLYQWLDGLCTDGSRNILIGTMNFNNTGIGYANYGQASAVDVTGYISSVQGATHTGFIPKTTLGSETTNYCDMGGIGASGVPLFGENFVNTSAAGIFALSITLLTTTANDLFGARLMYL